MPEGVSKRRTDSTADHVISEPSEMPRNVYLPNNPRMKRLPTVYDRNCSKQSTPDLPKWHCQHSQLIIPHERFQRLKLVSFKCTPRNMQRPRECSWQFKYFHQSSWFQSNFREPSIGDWMLHDTRGRIPRATRKQNIKKLDGSTYIKRDANESYKIATNDRYNMHQHCKPLLQRT